MTQYAKFIIPTSNDITSLPGSSGHGLGPLNMFGVFFFPFRVDADVDVDADAVFRLMTGFVLGSDMDNNSMSELFKNPLYNGYRII